MTIIPPKQETKKVKVVIDSNQVATDFRKWAKPGHFSRTIAKGPNTTTWVWNLHADAHDFDAHTSDLQEISRKIFSAHFGQLGIILIWVRRAFFPWSSVFELRSLVV
jgi:photosystem I P700 chlorophyll a apoprotein A1